MKKASLSGPFILKRKGCPLHYWLAGNDKAPWVVFCHGARMNHGIFEEQIREFNFTDIPFLAK